MLEKEWKDASGAHRSCTYSKNEPSDDKNIFLVKSGASHQLSKDLCTCRFPIN